MLTSSDASIARLRRAFVVLALLIGGAVAILVLLPPQEEDPAEFLQNYGELALVAGASEGLGAAWAEYLAARGLNLILIARHAPALSALATRLHTTYGVSVQWQMLDLGSVDEAAAQRLFGQRNVSLLVYNAAYTGSKTGYFEEEPLWMAQQAVDVNIRGVLSLVHPFLRARLARGWRGGEVEGRRGGVVLMSSMAGVVGSAHISAYAASKAWNTVFATSLYEELRGRGIDVLACLAGATTTPNYLDAALSTRSRLIEQAPAAVVDECAGALGRVPTRATGLVNRFGQVLLTRLLPTSVSVGMVSDGTLKTTSFEKVGPGSARIFNM